MASSVPFLLLCLLINIFHAHTYSIPSVSLVLPVTKHDSTRQYLTSLSYGTPLVPTRLVLDLGAPSLWIVCTSRNVPSSSLRPIPRRAIQCLMAKSHDIDTQTFSSPGKFADQDQSCQIFPENSITGTRPREGDLVEDIMAIQSTQESDTGNIETLHPFLFTCSPTQQLNGLAVGTKGMMGLGRARSSLSSQIFASFDTQRKLTLCLSSSTGVVLFGGSDLESQRGGEIFRSLTFTPLITNQKKGYPSQEYFIKLNSIKIDGKRLSLHKDQEANGGTQLSSIVPYTTMESSIYATFRKAYVKAAMSMNMTRVASVAPFGLCFSSKGVDSSDAGPNVPIIDFVLQSEMVKWRIYGRNSMVRLSSEVMCLAFVDGGLNPENPIVIGGYQLEDVIVQFDLETSMVGFSNSLLTRHSNCSDFKFGYFPAESV